MFSTPPTAVRMSWACSLYLLLINITPQLDSRMKMYLLTSIIIVPVQFVNADTIIIFCAIIITDKVK